MPGEKEEFKNGLPEIEIPDFQIGHPSQCMADKIPF